ncbi:unnamed protein product [Clonostachys rhizophaga]|uniref:N-acetyltransferase domain-containing protein n=1 Tax=Clonostachys rhizophaga TaxID=160324 RepID=A0A9N9VP19_9HYPO|nr:unnamed protein product [Clonostachys rhizophaga]
MQSPFALLTHDLILLPSPWAGDILAYRTLFRKLNADADFCRVAFGADFEPLKWTDEEAIDWFVNKDTATRWAVRGMGDFALGVLPTDEKTGKTAFHTIEGQLLKNPDEEVRKVTGDGFKELAKLFDQVRWAGYTCVREATVDGSDQPLPSWLEMIEVRYGTDPDFRGRGIATRAEKIVMDWAVEEHGVRRFIAETHKDNARSKHLLEKLGFEKIDTNYFQHEIGIEWAKVVSPRV